jgi:hypothetical protein
MPCNGFRSRSSREQSEFQKRVEAIDNVMLCVAEVEKMIRDIGRDMLPEADVLVQSQARRTRRLRSRSSWHKDAKSRL